MNGVLVLSDPRQERGISQKTGLPDAKPEQYDTTAKPWKRHDPGKSVET